MSAPPVTVREPVSLFDPDVRNVTVAVLMLVGLSAFEGLAVAAALPQVAASLGDVALLPWVITGYLLMSGVSTVAAGAIVDWVGLKLVFRVAVVLFVLGGTLAGLAPDMGLLVGARVLQGIGAGAVNAVGLTAVGLVFPPRLVGRAFAANSIVWGVMSVAGPGLAALLLMVASWRWIFLLNLPLGGLALAVCWDAMPGRPEKPTSQGIRWLDLAMLTVITGLLLGAVGTLDWVSIPMFLAAGLGTWGLLRRSRGRDDALLAPRHAVDAPLGPLAFAVMFLLIGAIGTQSFVPLYVSGARDGGTLLTAVSVLFFVLGWTSGANTGSRLVERIGAVQVLYGGASIVPFALAIVAGTAWLRGPLPFMFVGLFAAGLGMGATTNCALSLIRRLAEDGEMGRATAAHQFLRNMGFMLGNAFFGAVMLLVVGWITGDVESVREVLGRGHEVPPDPTVGAAIGTGFATAASIGSAVAAASGLPLLALRRHL